jgi:hypothetical protein
MAPELVRLTAKYSVITAITAFVTQPIPVADEIVVLPMHYWFAGVFIRKAGSGILRAPWLAVSAIIWGGVGARIASRLTLGFLPPAGAVANAVSSGAVTALLARYLDRRLPGISPVPAARA